MATNFLCNFNSKEVDVKMEDGRLYLNAKQMSTIADTDTKINTMHKPADWLLRDGVKEYIELRATANNLTYDDMVKKMVFNRNACFYFHYDICIGYAFIIHPTFASYLTEQFKRIQSGDLTLATEIKQTHEQITEVLEQQLIAQEKLVEKTDQEIADYGLEHLGGVVGRLMMCNYFKGNQQETTEQERRLWKCTSDENEAKIKSLMPAWKRYQEGENALYDKFSKLKTDVHITKTEIKKRHISALEAATNEIDKQKLIMINCHERLDGVKRHCTGVKVIGLKALLGL
jgi:hypothetical protein